MGAFAPVKLIVPTRAHFAGLGAGHEAERAAQGMAVQQPIQRVGQAVVDAGLHLALEGQFDLAVALDQHRSRAVDEDGVHRRVGPQPVDQAEAGQLGACEQGEALTGLG